MCLQDPPSFLFTEMIMYIILYQLSLLLLLLQLLLLPWSTCRGGGGLDEANTTHSLSMICCYYDEDYDYKLSTPLISLMVVLNF